MAQQETTAGAGIKRYTFDELTNVHHGIVISQPGGAGPVTVYIPPREDQLPYERTFADMSAAEEFASQELTHVGGTDTYVVAKDDDRWWLANLHPAG